LHFPHGFDLRSCELKEMNSISVSAAESTISFMETAVEAAAAAVTTAPAASDSADA
jgi:hypothetical protein